jgi:hypothetical protein
MGYDIVCCGVEGGVDPQKLLAALFFDQFTNMLLSAIHPDLHCRPSASHVLLGCCALAIQVDTSDGGRERIACSQSCESHHQCAALGTGAVCFPGQRSL